jgi:serine/threonine protein kinase
MATQPIANCCPKCQTPLPPDAPQGLCPKCLFAAVATPTEANQPAGNRPAPPSLPDIAVAFPQLEILEFIGQGGMGFVFKARQPKLDRLVALKILPQSLAADPTFAERFNHEARLLARLNHPGIVAVHDFGVATGRAGSPLSAEREDEHERRARSDAPYQSQSQFYYLLMEFVDGVNLRQAMQAGRFTPDQALAIVPKICEALQFAHNEGVLHRDIKPENILLDARGRVKIADFGIAKLMERGWVADQPQHVTADKALRLAEDGTAALPNLTEAGKTLGSPNYMAPEQIEHPGEVDHRADIYSLGVVFYEMLTGELPLGRFAPPSQKSAADPRVDEVVLRALEKERERRQHSVGEVRTQVETIASTSGGSRRQPHESEATVDVETQSGPSQAGANKRRLTGLQILLRSVVVVFIAGLLVFALAAAVTSLLPKTYAATARVELSSQDGNFLQNEFARMESPEFLKQVAAAADLKTRWKSSLSGSEAEQTEQIIVRLRNEMELRPVRNTRLIGISFYSESPGEAADIANAITTVYCGQPGTRIIGIAEVPARPVRPNAMLNLAIGVVGGGFFGLVAGGLTALFLVRRKSLPSNDRRGDEARTEKSEIGNRKPDRFWRWFAVAVFAMIAIPFLISIVGLLVAIAIPNFVKGRAQAQENARRAAAQLTTKTIVLTRATNQLVGTTSDTRTVSVWSDSTLLPGEKFRQITRRPDGETMGAVASLFSRYKSGKAGTSTVFTWWFKEEEGFGEAEAEAATAQIREHWTQTPLTFTSSAPCEVFCVTNAHGATLAGSIEFVRETPEPPDAAGQIKATVQIKHFGNTSSFPSIGFMAEVPDGYALRATSNYGEGDIHSPAGPYNYDGTWFPMNYGLRQPLSTSVTWNLQQAPTANVPSWPDESSEKFEIVLGQPRLICSITNGPDDVFQGFLELVGPAEAGVK